MKFDSHFKIYFQFQILCYSLSCRSRHGLTAFVQTNKFSRLLMSCRLKWRVHSWCRSMFLCRNKIMHHCCSSSCQICLNILTQRGPLQLCFRLTSRKCFFKIMAFQLLICQVTFYDKVLEKFVTFCLFVVSGKNLVISLDRH